ncbi:sodium-dependent bicarbonate transport family permease [Polynucleobacter sp. MWH-Loch1C5]|uniref:sodium-dependent bicarbonate transport family permease n=1 Tax=Polynucleobacter sp. MWH-Loch1C5 TaxID=2689108 RepID=UPI001C0E067F|nr:sodium-dependent bicarbonate transport family permease [Polynucleobacter sp. MWH-Loch1C5]MBU3542906.1 sodium-dependent bicarbonate transport family permease [Polynucleobacter sp. MWH-Loch1C5]
MANFIDPAILFFVFGFFAGFVKSNLEIPPQISRFLSLYLLMALGLKGGFALAQSGFTAHVALSLGIAVFMAILVPLVAYSLLSRVISRFDAAALAATYGSVSAVTFITATQHLDQSGIAYGGHMAAAMALMESPAIIIAILFANRVRQSQANGQQVENVSIGKLLHESFTDGAQLLLLGAMVVGLATGDGGQKVMGPFSVDLFKGMLAFFLLDMGLTAARNFKSVLSQSFFVALYGVVAPITHAMVALGLCYIFGLPLGETVLLMVLAASASYIAVPAVLRESMPEANPGLYFGMSLGLTFPLNIIVGIPLYTWIAEQVIR